VRFVDSTCDTPVFDRASLAAGHVITGPAIIEEAASVTVLGPQHRLIVDDYGNLMIAAANQP
jgi:N-methylhydantoinase A